jgi:glyoxylase-like metal-dependent hydrolase (beta-lactamase superfamily II)
VHGAEIIGPETINKNYHAGDKTRMFNTLSENAIKGTKIIKVDASYKDAITFNVSGVDFEYVPVGQGHSVEDYFLYMPKNKLIFAGDLVMNGRITSNRDGLVIGQLNALKAINSKDWNILIPGHGFIIDKTATDESVKYFTLTKERVLKAIDDGVDIDDITKTVTLPEFKDKAMYELLNSGNVYRSYAEMEMYDEDDE